MPEIDFAALRGAVERLATGPDDAAARSRALETFAAGGFPTRASEAWRYTSASPLAQATQDWLEASPDTVRPAPDWSPGDSTLRFTDARLAADADALQLPAGARLRLVEPGDSDNAEPIRALSDAVGSPIYELRIAAGAEIGSPLRIEHATTDSAAARLSALRLRIVCEPGSAVTLVETFHHWSATPVFLCPRLVVDVQNGARLSHFRRQSVPSSARIVECLDAVLSDDARYDLFTLDAGAGLARVDVDARLEGSGARVTLAGVGLASARRTIDHHLITRHAAGDATSCQDVAAIAGAAGEITFRGKVIVDDGADGSDSVQSSRNLLLADSARINTRPELEIYADDVKCAHGATTGQLDETALFYLASRGLSAREAREVLIRAFVRRALERIDDESLRSEFDTALAEALDELLTEYDA